MLDLAESAFQALHSFLPRADCKKWKARLEVQTAQKNGGDFINNLFVAYKVHLAFDLRDFVRI